MNHHRSVLLERKDFRLGMRRTAVFDSEVSEYVAGKV